MQSTASTIYSTELGLIHGWQVSKQPFSFVDTPLDSSLPNSSFHLFALRPLQSCSSDIIVIDDRPLGQSTYLSFPCVHILPISICSTASLLHTREVRHSAVFRGPVALQASTRIGTTPFQFSHSPWHYGRDTSSNPILINFTELG